MEGFLHFIIFWGLNQAHAASAKLTNPHIQADWEQTCDLVGGFD